MYRTAYRQDENTVCYFDKCGNKHVCKNGNLARRINNPGLVKSHSHYASINGSIGSHQGFAIFSDSKQGHKALSDWLHSKKYYNSNIRVIADHYQPKNKEAFAYTLSSLTAIPLVKKINTLTKIEFEKLLKTIEKLCSFELIGNEESFILPKITAKIENCVDKEDTYLIGMDVVLSKKEAMEWIKTSRLDAVIVHQKNGSLHLRSRPAHCIWNITK